MLDDTPDLRAALPSSALDDAALWPELPLDAWSDSRETLHRYVQVLGKVRMALAPPRNHWWHVALYVSVDGFTTGPMPDGGRLVEVRLDVLGKRVVVTASDGGRADMPLHGQSVAAFLAGLLDCLAQVDCRPMIHPVPFDLADQVRFTHDTAPRAWDVVMVRRFWQVAANLLPVFEEFAGWSVAKTSPVHLFWHSLDLAVTRFTGRSAPLREDVDEVTRQAYSHEVASFGFWAGDDQTPFPALYAYAAPEPDGLASRPLLPEQARWVDRGTGSLAVLPYDAVRTAAAPRLTVLGFLQSAWEAAAAAGGWPAGDLVSPHAPMPRPGRKSHAA